MDRKKLTRITREKAENLIDKSSVSASKVYHKKDEIHVTFKLSDNSSIIYKFDTRKKTKSYFIKLPK
jgi:hypothetical protein